MAIERGKSNGIIGDRSFSTDKLIISQLGKLCIQFHNKNKIGTIITYIGYLSLLVSVVSLFFSRFSRINLLSNKITKVNG